ncbi:Solute carrier family 40 member 3, chloroplastic [Coccomyxa sp. Obi]|nr:Solute carrier family 40 member 3, chloroplastic [Coccomyxa sp. Obi]
MRCSGSVMVHVLHLGPALDLQRSTWFPVLLCCTMLERLSAFASDIAIERDWITQLSGKTNPEALSTSNAILRRMDMLSEMVGTLCFGWCFTQLGAAKTLTTLITFAALSLPAMLCLIDRVAEATPRVMVRMRSLAMERAANPPLPNPFSDRHLLRGILYQLGLQVQQTLDGWKLYLRQPILPASLAYIMLYFNAAVLLAGAALLYKTFLHKPVDVLVSDTAGLLGGTVMGIPLAVAVFSALIMLSRIGLWSYDMVDSQLFQMAIQPKEAASVSSAEWALCSGSELVMLGLAAAFSEPASFSLLVNLSAASVLGAACLYSTWVFACDGQRTLQAALGSA